MCRERMPQRGAGVGHIALGQQFDVLTRQRLRIARIRSITPHPRMVTSATT
jgi:hypothetical protein